MNTEEPKGSETPASGSEPARASSKEPRAFQDTKAGKRLSKTRPVTVYLAVLFVVALLLLVMSFFMQQRSHQALADLNESMSESQDINDLKLELQQTQFQLKEAQDQLTDYKELQEQVKELEQENEALEWLRQIESAVRTSYSATKELIDQFEETGLDAYLPSESAVPGQESPAETYRNIYAMLY